MKLSFVNSLELARLFSYEEIIEGWLSRRESVMSSPGGSITESETGLQEAPLQAQLLSPFFQTALTATSPVRRNRRLAKGEAVMAVDFLSPQHSPS